ncbi:aromatase/cyclase [Amycolatopsis sp. cg9]|uniref:aromatase/cyclase n=1 Tax=Amycolatopsis sp. cg9 TaxID=3238801 RepID=UPI0035257483
MEHTTHTRVIAAPPDDVYRVVADVSRWPVVFGPTVHVHHLERDERAERFRLWAVVAGEVAAWISRRDLDPVARRIEFRQEHSRPPVAAMSGTWSFQPHGYGGTEVVLDHRFSVTDASARDTLVAAVDRNSTEELAALGRITELGHPVDEVIDTFSDTVVLDGELADVYEFVHRSDLWPDRLPHVARVELTEDAAGVQHMEMDTITADGTAHTTRSIRVCHPGESIAYTQLVPPAMLLGHSGHWTFRRVGRGVEATATHTVAIDPEAARAQLGEHSTLADARAYLRENLGANGRATLSHAGAFAHLQGRVLPPHPAPGVLPSVE